MIMDGVPIEVETKSRERRSHKGKKSTSKMQDDVLNVQDEKDLHNNLMTMDGAPVEVETKSRENKSHKGKKTTPKLQDDFLKVQDEKAHSERKSKDHELEATPIKKKKAKKRVASEVYPLSEETCIPAGEMQEFVGEVDLDEPTMEEKLASLDLLNDDKSNSSSKQDPSPALKPPSADSVHILLKQALHAEDHTLLLNCLYTRDQKVIEKSISLLNPAEILKLLASLKSMLPSRGAVLVCALPWLSTLLSQHASIIASQESSLLILNSLYQLIDSRISTFSSAIRLSTSLDYLLARTPPRDEADDEKEIPPIVYEDKDSEEEESENEMEIDENSEELGDVIDASQESNRSEVMSG